MPDTELTFSSLLDGPAGKHGFVTSRDGHLFFEDGQRARFWGVNLAGSSALQPPDVVDRIVADLVSHGCNMVRVHAVDHPIGYLSVGDGEMDVEGGPLGTLIAYDGNSRSLNPDSMRRLDYLIARCKAAGIYIYIDLLDYRLFMKEDGLPRALDGAAKPVSIYNQRIHELQEEYAAQLLTHANEYTGIRLCDDPVLAMVEITNENSLFWTGWGHVPEPFLGELKARWNSWLLGKYGDRAGLAAGWQRTAGTAVLQEQEDPQAGSVALPASFRASGDAAADTRSADVSQFCYDLEVAYYRRLKAFLRSIGVRVPISACVTNHVPADMQAVAAELDFISNGLYVSHPNWRTMEIEGANELRRMLGGVSAMARTKVADKPLVVREWNYCWPNHWRQTGIVQAAAYGCLQDWDGFILYAYARHHDLAIPESERPPVGHDSSRRNRLASCFFDSYSDSSRWTAFALGAAIFLGQKVAVAPHLLELGICDNEAYQALQEVPDDPVLVAAHVARVQRRFFAKAYPQTSAVGVFRGPSGLYPAEKPTLLYQSGKMLHQASDGGGSVGNGPAAAVYDEPWYARIIAEMSRWLGAPCLAQAQAQRAWLSETGELRRDYGRGRFSIVTDQCLLVAGEGDNETMSAGGLETHLANSSIVVGLLSLDGKPLLYSDDVLLTIVPDGHYEGQTVNEKWIVAPGRPPMHMEPVSGEIRHPRLAALPHAVVYDGAMMAQPLAASAIERQGDRLVLHEVQGVAFLRFSASR